MKSVNVFERKDVLWVAPASLTEHELWVLDGPAVVLLASAEAADKGEAVLFGLRRSRRIPHPTSWNTRSPMLLASGAKSWGAFEKHARLVVVELDAQLSVIPTRHPSIHDGFIRSSEQALVLPSTAAPEQLGNAVEQALARCE